MSETWLESILTCLHDVKEAGQLLPANGVAGPARQGSKVKVAGWFVVEGGGEPRRVHALPRNVQHIPRPVVRPAEAHRRRVRLHLAPHAQRLVPHGAQLHVAAAFAPRRDWNRSCINIKLKAETDNQINLKFLSPRGLLLHLTLNLDHFTGKLKI